METNDQINKFKNLFEQNFYKSKILDKIRHGKTHLVISFSELLNHSPKLAEELLNNPEELLKSAEESINDLYDCDKFFIRVKKIPPTDEVPIRKLRSKHIGTFLCCKGYVKSKSDVRPQIISARFECPSCGNIINVLQLEQKFKEPFRCGCGRKGKFRLLSKELVDGFSMVIEEAPEDVSHGTNLKRLNVFVKDDLTDSQIEDPIQPGIKISINGILKEKYRTKKDGSKDIQMDLYMDANYIEFMETTFEDIKISKEEEEKIKELASKDDVLKIICDSIYGGIYGNSRLKEAVMLQSFGGIWRDDTRIPMRGAIHILMLGDPGTVKSTLLKITETFLPKCRFASGTSSSGRGLTGAVVKDEFLGGFTAEAGVLPLANEGVALIDELDKAGRENVRDLHVPLEQGIVQIDKANIHTTLLCRTSVLAAANPKLGRFDNYSEIYTQIDLEPTLISRFDLIFPLKDEADEKKDTQIAMKILHPENKKETNISSEFIKKYIAYAKKINPELSFQLADRISKKYASIRKLNQSAYGESKSFPISPRQVGALKRLAEAHARMKLRDFVCDDDVDFAFEIIDYSLREIALDKDTGKIDIDRLEIGISTTKRNKYEIILHLFDELEETIGKLIPWEQIEEKLKGKMESFEIEEIVNKLIQRGDLIETKRGFYQKI